MKSAHHTPSVTPSVAKLVQTRIENGGDRLWRMQDFSDQPFPAVARALSRLARAGIIQRVSKGVYYRARATAFGPSRPNQAAIRKLAARQKALFPAGSAAANLLGLTTQTTRRPEVATPSSSLPRKLIGSETVVHTRRPEAWVSLADTEAAILDFLRQRGRTGELAPKETIGRITELLSDTGTFSRLARVAIAEPPRVRALLGALGENSMADPMTVQGLRKSLNPLSRFDFGIFAELPNAKAWQAKEKRQRALV